MSIQVLVLGTGSGRKYFKTITDVSVSISGNMDGKYPDVKVKGMPRVVKVIDTKEELEQ